MRDRAGGSSDEGCWGACQGFPDANGKMHKRGQADAALQPPWFADAEQFVHDPAEVVVRRGGTKPQSGDQLANHFAAELRELFEAAAVEVG